MRRSVIAAGALVLAAAMGRAAAPPVVGFGTPVHVPGGSLSSIPLVFDATGDGHKDIVLSSQWELAIRVLPGNGDGTFGAPIRSPTSRVGGSLFLHGPLDGDGVDDIVMDSNGKSGVELLLSDGSGGFTSTVLPWTSSEFIGAEFPALLDFDGDGDLDIFSASNGLVYGVRLNDGSGHFGTATVAPIAVPVQTFNTRAFPADYDGDGDDDLLVQAAKKFSVFWHESDGTFSAAQELTFTGMETQVANSVATADFDGDGRIDIAGLGTHRIDDSDEFEGRLFVLMHDSARTFGTASFVVTEAEVAAGASGITAADLNGDSRPEVVCNTGLFVNAGDGTFADPRPLPVSGGRVAATGDFDGNGAPDVALAVSGGGASGDAAHVLLVGEPGTHLRIDSFSPPGLFRGVEADVVVTGADFHPAVRITTGAFLKVSQVVVESPTRIRARIAVAADARPFGGHEVRFENPDGAVATGSFEVRNGGHAFVSLVTPNRVHAGQNVLLQLFGSEFDEPLGVSFGEGVTVETVTKTTEFSVLVRISVAEDAAPGPRNLTVTTGSGLATQFPGALSVLGPRTLFLTQTRGRARVDPRIARSSISISGTIEFNHRSADARFDTGSDTVELRIGDEDEPLVLEILPGAGWKVARNRAEWRSPRRSEIPRIKLVLDLAKHRFRLDVTRANLGLPDSGDIELEMQFGDDSGVTEARWLPSRGGFVLK